MNRLTTVLARTGAISVLALGAFGVSFALPAATPTAAELQAKADQHTMMAADYRARMQADPKHAIAYFTQANHCDKQALKFRTAALQAEDTPAYRR